MCESSETCVRADSARGQLAISGMGSKHRHCNQISTCLTASHSTSPNLSVHLCKTGWDSPTPQGWCEG